MAIFEAQGVPAPHYEITGNGGDGIKLTVSITDGFGAPLGGTQADDIRDDLVSLLDGYTGVTDVTGTKTTITSVNF